MGGGNLHVLVLFAGSWGAVLGVLPDWSYRNNRRQLEGGDPLVLFTDGVTDAEDAHGEEFGEEQVVRVLRNAAGR